MSYERRRIAALERVIEKQQDEISVLKELQFEALPFVTRALGLTKLETRLLEFLMKREVAPKESCLAAMYSDRNVDDWAEIKMVDVYVCKLRKKLKPHRIEISVAWGFGYFISPENKQKIRAFDPAQKERAA